jgi:hypothetical protein
MPKKRTDVPAPVGFGRKLGDANAYQQNQHSPRYLDSRTKRDRDRSTRNRNQIFRSGMGEA